MDIKEESNDYYDSPLEPDVILIDSDQDSNISLSTSNPDMPSKSHMFKDIHLENKIQLLNKSVKEGALQQCPTCKKYFKRLSSHLKTHQELKFDPDRPHACEVCHKLFKNVNNLAIHSRSHTGVKPYICAICNKGFTQSGNLAHHVRIHTGDKPFKCPVCERAFTQPGNLGNHMRLHSQEKPFQCHLCDRAFTQSSNLNSHIRNNHKNVTSQI